MNTSLKSELSSDFSDSKFSPHNPEHLISRLLMGYVEKNVSPHTIADVIRTQLMDTGLKVSMLSEPAFNGVIEVLTSVSTTQMNIDILLYFSGHPDFPKLLSPRASFGLVLSFLRYLPMLEERFHGAKLAKIGQILEKLAHELLTNNFDSSYSPSEKTRIINCIKILPENLRVWVSAMAPSLIALRNESSCETPVHVKQGITAPKPSVPYDIFRSILELGEQSLVQKGVLNFRIVPNELALEWKIANTFSILEKAASTKISSFRRAFLIEWFFDGLLREILHNPSFAINFEDCLKLVTDNIGFEEGVLKGILRALQRDISSTAIELNYPASKHPRCEELLTKANSFFFCILALASKDLAKISKVFAVWALQMPVHPAQTRFFTRTSWQWIRSLASGQWEDDLREPPPWLLNQINKYAAQIFRITPSFWLQEHSPLVIEKLYSESILSGFSATEQHINYVEYLCRTLRKKSPAFASRNEILLALRLLGRSTSQEENQLTLVETRYRMLDADKAAIDYEKQFWIQHFKANKVPERYGANPVARALHVLLHTTKLVARAYTHRK